MEISLDPAFIRPILAQEHERASRDIRELGVMRALENSQQRHDSRIASAPDVNTLACGAGCSWCCYFTVDVRAGRGIQDSGFRRAHVHAGSQGAGLPRKCAQTARCISTLDEDERMTRNVKCPFLMAGRCSIYEARPQTCRNYHATNATGCQQSYEDPGNLEIDPDFAPFVYQAGGAHVEAFSTAMSDAGYDVSVYELNCAIDAALSEPAARERFEARLPPFVALSGDEVPVEFGDVEGLLLAPARQLSPPALLVAHSARGQRSSLALHKP